MDLSKVLNKILDDFPTKEDTFEFFKRNHEYFSEGKYKAWNFDAYKSKFSSRSEDKTPSTLCKPKLTTVDFGDSGKHKGILEFIVDIEQQKGNNLELPKDFPKAVNILIKLSNFDKSQNLDDYQPTAHVVEEEPKVKEYSIKYVERQRKNSIKNKKNKELFTELMSGLCRSCSIEEMRRAVKIFRIGLSDYLHEDKETGKSRRVFRLFIPEYSKDLVAYGCFKYNRNEDPKGLLRKNSIRVLFGNHISHVFNPLKPTIFAEGHSDVIVNNAKKLQTITSGSATTPLKDNIEEMKGGYYHFFYDLDLPGVKGITDRIAEIELFNASCENEKDKIKYKIFAWSKKLIIDNKVIELTSYEDEQKELLKKLVIRGLKLDEDYLFEKSKVSSWHFLSEVPKKKGYDWIDFHTEMKGHENYDRFIGQYTY